MSSAGPTGSCPVQTVLVTMNLCTVFVVIAMYYRFNMVHYQIDAIHYRQEAEYWRNRSLFMESNYVPDGSDLFDKEELTHLAADVLLDSVPFLGTVTRWGRNIMDRQELQEMREQNDWNRIYMKSPMGSESC